MTQAESSGNGVIKSDQSFLQYLEMTADAIIVVNRDGIIIRANVLAGAMFGYDTSELIDSPVERLMPERFKEAHPAHRRTFFRHPSVRGMGENLDLYGVRSDGREFPVEIALRPVELDNEPCVLAIIRNIPVPKKMEIQLAELSTRLAQLNDIIAASITPLTERVNTLEDRMTNFEKAYEKNSELLQNIHRTMNSLSHFLKKFFQFAGALVGAVLIAVAIAYALHWLHLKS